MFFDKMIPTDVASLTLNMSSDIPVTAELQGTTFVIRRRGNEMGAYGGPNEASVTTVLKDGYRYVSEKQVKRAFRELNLRWIPPGWLQ